MSIDHLLQDLAVMRAKAVIFQASSIGWGPAWWRCVEAGYQVEIWASCSQISEQDLRNVITWYKPARVIIQIESERELTDFRLFHNAGHFQGVHLDVVITYMVFPDHQEMAQRGIERTWCEAYLQDGREPNDFVNQATRWWLYPNPRPVIGCYNNIGPNQYSLGPFERKYSVWRWEQCDRAWFAQMP